MLAFPQYLLPGCFSMEFCFIEPDESSALPLCSVLTLPLLETIVIGRQKYGRLLNLGLFRFWISSIGNLSTIATGPLASGVGGFITIFVL